MGPATRPCAPYGSREPAAARYPIDLGVPICPDGVEPRLVRLAARKAERASLAAKGRQAIVETEAAPIHYVAELVGANTDSERVIRWLISLIVLCCDPLADMFVAKIQAMAEKYDDREIAAQLNGQALTSSTGKPFTGNMVRWIRFKHRIPGPSLSPWHA